MYVCIHTPPRAPSERGTSVGPGAGGLVQAEADRSRSPTKEMPSSPAFKRPAIQDEGHLLRGRGAASGTRSSGAVVVKKTSIDTMLEEGMRRAVGIGGASAAVPAVPPLALFPKDGERTFAIEVYGATSSSAASSALPAGVAPERRGPTGRAAHVHGPGGDGLQRPHRQGLGCHIRRRRQFDSDMPSG